MRPADFHLTPQEMELLLFGPADPRDSKADSASAREAQQHLSECAVCQSVAEKYRKADELLRALRADAGNSNATASGAVKRGPDCPDEQTWLSWAAGLLTDEEAAGYVAHAASCSWCAPLLREAMEDLSYDVTPEEQQALAQLPTASPEWQREMARKLAAQSTVVERTTAANAASIAETPVANAAEKEEERSTPKGSPATKPKKAGFRWSPKLTWAGAGLAMLAVATWFTIGPVVNQLLIQTYADRRPFELRMSGASYGRSKSERGGDQGERDLPAQFHLAESIIETELSRHPEDPMWLQAQARAHLLEWKYTRAEQELDDALMFKPNDPSLLLDKATALYQKGKREGKIYYGDAIDDLGKVLKQNPNDPVALFNRAILYQEWPIPDKAIEDLNHYLQIDSNSAWAEEARERLKQLEKQVKDHARAQEPLVAPQAFAVLTRTPAGADQLDQRIEEYQEVALKSWLPQTFSSKLSLETRQENSAGLRALATLLQKRHGDRWFSDLLDAADNSPDSIAGINVLGQAVSDSAKGNATDAYAEAESAAKFFTAAGNRPGVLRAEVEQVYSLRNMQQGSQCLEKAGTLSIDLGNGNYIWMQAQFYADLCSCHLMRKEFDQARTFASRALEESKKGRFPVAQLRSISMAAFVETDEGQLLAAWKLNQEGLSAFWNNDFSPVKREQQFYDDLTYAAENTSNLNLAVTLAQESVEMITLSGDHLTEAAAREHLAELEVRNGQLSLAAQELQNLDTLTTLFAAKPGMEAYRIYAQTALAEIELQEGKLQQAKDRLNAIREDVDGINSFTVARAFYLAYGKLSMAQGKLSEAEWAFQNAATTAQLVRQQNSSAQYAWAQENSGIYRSLIQLELKKGDKREALAAWEWYRAALHGQGSTSLRSLQSLWGSGEFEARLARLKDRTVISYSLLPEGLAIWIFDDRGFDMHWAPIDTATLADLETYFFEMCSDPQSDLRRLQTRGHRLFDVLIRPVIDRLQPERLLVIEPDEIIGDLPFEALVTGENQYFGEKYRIAFSPGLLYADSRQHSGSISRDSHVLVVGSTANFIGLETTLNPAIDVVEEAESVAGFFPNAVLLKDHSATVEAMETALPQAGILHFAGHAISSAQREGLLLFKAAGDNEKESTIWGAERVSPVLFRNARLVVLSACATSESYRGRKEVHGELARALLLAGVPTVVGSRWNVESSTTSQYMNYFYTALISHQSVPSAMQEAESSTRNQPETRHPYYWAAFSTFGRA
ncbi:MAG TPA: CHAT domain-containing protein [Candidatus Angelobacter sp.]|nr:CHAT domain-containing protein [Candidatus Angelobacter sp.]